MTKLKTGHEYREDNKRRVKEYRENMKAQGYKSLTVMLSPTAQESLKKLKNTGLTTNAVIENALNSLAKTIKTGSVTRNVTGKITRTITDNIPKQLKPSSKQKEFLYNKILELKDKVSTNGEIAELLNKEGLKTIKGLDWKSSSVRDYLKRYKS